MINDSPITDSVFGRVREATRLQKSDEVRKYVSPQTRFITIADARQVSDPAIVTAYWGHTNPLNEVATYKPFEGKKYTGYLMHDGHKLTFITPKKTVFSVPIAEVSHVETKGKLFIVSLANTHYVFAEIVGVEYVRGTNYQTVDNMSDITGGWYKQFVALGVISPQQAAKDKRSNKLFLILWAIGTIALTVLVFTH
jgi:hypothetical protein